MVSAGAHTHVSFSSMESVVNLSAARVLQKPAPSLSDLCVCVCAFVRISEARHPWSRFRCLQGVCIHAEICYQCYTRVYVADARTAEKPWSVMSDTRTYTCVFHKHGVSGHGSGLWCLSVVFGDVDVCVCEWGCC